MRTTGSKNHSTPARRRAILDAALRIFATRGYERATIDEVAERVGVTKGSLYHHFANKEEIAVTLYGEAIAAVHATVGAAIQKSKHPRDGVEGLVLAYLTWFEQNPALGAFVFEVMDGLASAKVEHVRAAQDEFIEKAAEWLAGHARRALLRPMPRTIRESLVLGPLRDFLRRWFRRGTRAEMEHAKRLLPGAVWRSLAN